MLEVYAIYQDILSIKNITDPSELLEIVMRVIMRGNVTYQVCKNVEPQEIVIALKKHTNQEGVNCLEDTLKYSNEIQDLILQILAGDLDIEKLIEECVEFKKNLPNYINNCSNMDFHLS